MHRAVLVILAISVLLASVAAIAQVQPGSTGGNIGRQDKSMSGGGTPEKSPPAHHPVAKNPVAKSSSCGRIVGTWKWALGTTTVIKSNGSASNSIGSTATWTCNGSQYVFIWSNGFTDHISISTDGNSLDVVNNQGGHFSPTRF
jgi:hypothetical protein